ncbi:MAG: dihydrofolate reductase [Ignavibacteria bacterium]|nr:MAG: dihydrofolate reductase [Ignavibacteria bacterium]KAF0161043.1 MAG: dihydrofolate reductase [Ignavibacteria bacterium]
MGYPLLGKNFKDQFRLEKIIIAAVSKNGVIGNEGKIPWDCKAELQHFKKTTSGFPIIMGRKTWEAIATPLKNRVNIIISRSLKSSKKKNDYLIFSSLKKSLAYCESNNHKKCFIIGGTQIYKTALPLADVLIISEMKFEVEGDAKFPEFKKAEWKMLSSEELSEFTIHTYIRKENLQEC